MIQTSHRKSRRELSMCEVEYTHEKFSGLALSDSSFEFTTLPGGDQRLFLFY